MQPSEITAMKIRMLPDERRFEKLTSLISQYGMSAHEITLFSDYETTECVYTDLKYFRFCVKSPCFKSATLLYGLVVKQWLSSHTQQDIDDILSLHGNQKYAIAINQYHISYDLLRRHFYKPVLPFSKQITRSDIDQIHILTKRGLSFENVCWLANTQRKLHWRVVDMIEYFNLQKSDYQAALQYYGFSTLAQVSSKEHAIAVNSAATQIKRVYTVSKLMQIFDIQNANKASTAALVTLTDIARQCNLPASLFRISLKQMMSHHDYARLVSLSSLANSRLKYRHQYGVDFPLQVKNLFTKSQATLAKNYHTPIGVRPSKITEKIAKTKRKYNQQGKYIQSWKHAGEINAAYTFIQHVDTAVNIARNMNSVLLKCLENIQQQVHNQAIEQVSCLYQSLVKRPNKIFTWLLKNSENDTLKTISWPSPELVVLLKNLKLTKNQIRLYAQSDNSLVRINHERLNLSKYEAQLYDLLLQLPREQRPKFIMHDRQQLTYDKTKHYELDFYFPELRIGIELNPSRYHNLNQFSKGSIKNVDNLAHRKSYHFDKFICAKQHNIRLIQLFQYDLASSIFVSKTWPRIKAILCKTNQLIDASQLSIKRDVATKSRHLNSNVVYAVHNHLQHAVMTVQFRQNSANDSTFTLAYITSLDSLSHHSILVQVIQQFYHDHPHANKVILCSNNNWDSDITYVTSGFSFANYSYDVPVYISQNEIDGENSIYSYQLFASASTVNSIVNRDRRMKHLPRFDQYTDTANVEKYIETELTHKGYTEKFKSKHNRMINTASDVINNHKGYDRIFTAGYTNWIAQRENFIK